MIRRQIHKPIYPVAIAALLPMAAVLWSGCKKSEAPAPPPPTVEVVAVEQRDVPIYSEAVGTLEADVNATISAQVTGYIISRDYTEGSLVASNQLLFQIDDRTYQAALDQAVAKVTKTKQDVDRYTPLAATQAISQQELEDAIQANIAAKAAADAARLNVQFCKIVSPIDGVAGLAQGQVGDLVGPGTGALTTVTTIDPIRVYFSVAQQLATQIMEQRLARGEKIGSPLDKPLQLTLASGMVYQHPGRIRFADNQINVKTGTIRLVGEFPNHDRLLVPGMFVRVRATIGTNQNALLVPQRAVAELQGRTLIAVVGADNKVGIRPITTGVVDGDMWVVTGPLKPGDRVVAEGIQKVRDGATVNPVPFVEKTVAATTPATKAEEKP
jgi:membrane fusion protein, multidrug efflux system